MKEMTVRNVTFGTGIPKICVPIVGKTEEEILCQAKHLVDLPADLAEWRADWYKEWEDIDSVKHIAKKLREILGEMPILFTFRTAYEGGASEIDEEMYGVLSLGMAGCEAIDLLDVEAFRKEKIVKQIIETAHMNGKKVIISNHDFSATPSEAEIVRRLSCMQRMGADMAKIAVMPQSMQDVITLMGASLQCNEELSCPIITMAMGAMGSISRICGEFSGSAITFASAKVASAPGQMEAAKMKYMLETLHKSMKTE